VQEEGKIAAEQKIRKLLDQYFEAIIDQREAEILSFSETQTRTYWWCNPPRIGNESTHPIL
jgi:hypothetical protein